MRSDTISAAAHRRHVRFFKVFRPIMLSVFKRKMNYEWDDLSSIEGPYLLLSNHNTNYDPIFIGIATKNQLYFVSSEHVMRKKFLGWLLHFFLCPILHLKGKAGVKTISNMLRALKSGYNVAIFPEGNRSFNGVTCDFLPTIGKLARKSGAKLVTVRMEGGYFSQPRWAFSDRKGKLTTRLVHVYDVDELKAMTDDEVNDAIVRDLAEDAYATQQREPIAFKGKDLALGLDTTLFACPKCKKIGTLHSSHSKLFCDCGYEMNFDEYGMLTDSENHKYTITELDNMQRELLLSLKSDTPADKVLFEDDVNIMEITPDHKIASKKAVTLRAYCDRAECGGTVITPGSLSGMAIRSRNTIVAHTADNGTQYEIKGIKESSFNALKYLYLYNSYYSQSIDNKQQT